MDPRLGFVLRNLHYQEIHVCGGFMMSHDYPRFPDFGRVAHKTHVSGRSCFNIIIIRVNIHIRGSQVSRRDSHLSFIGARPGHHDSSSLSLSLTPSLPLPLPLSLSLTSACTDATLTNKHTSNISRPTNTQAISPAPLSVHCVSFE